MLGAIASRNVKRYVACDPSSETFSGLRKMVKDLAHITSTDCVIHKTPAEEYEPDRRAFDLVFTSPPYGRTEIYSDEPTQSCHRYPLLAAWTEGFLRPVVQRAAYALCPRGWLLLNVANTRQHPTIVEDVERVAAEEGFQQHPTLLMEMSGMAGSRPSRFFASGYVDASSPEALQHRIHIAAYVIKLFLLKRRHAFADGEPLKAVIARWRLEPEQLGRDRVANDGGRLAVNLHRSDEMVGGRAWYFLPHGLVSSGGFVNRVHLCHPSARGQLQTQKNFLPCGPVGPVGPVGDKT
jgi:hypothetical protein